MEAGAVIIGLNHRPKVSILSWKRWVEMTVIEMPFIIRARHFYADGCLLGPLTILTGLGHGNNSCG